MLNTTHLKHILLVLFSITMTFPGQHQDSNPRVLYPVSYNDTEQRSSIWTYDISTQKLKSIFALDRTSREAADLAFPTIEKISISDRADELRGIGISWQDKQLTQSINGVWKVDASQLLVQITRQYCFSVVGDTCYGFYGFVYLDTVTNKITPWLTLPLHDPASFDIRFCKSGQEALVDGVYTAENTPYIAYVLTSKRRCYEAESKPTRAYIYQKGNTVPLHMFDNVNGLSWSPDGTQLSFIHLEKTDSDFVGTLEIYRPKTDQTLRLDTTDEFYDGIPLATTWLTSNKIAYQWRDVKVSETGEIIKVFDTQSQSIRIYPIDSFAPGAEFSGISPDELLTITDNKIEVRTFSTNVVSVMQSWETVLPVSSRARYWQIKNSVPLLRQQMPKSETITFLGI